MLSQSVLEIDGAVSGRMRIRGQAARSIGLSARAFVLVEVEAHRAQYVRRLGELDIGIFDHLDPIAPEVEKVEERARHQLAAGGLDPRAQTRPRA